MADLCSQRSPHCRLKEGGRGRVEEEGRGERRKKRNDRKMEEREKKRKRGEGKGEEGRTGERREAERWGEVWQQYRNKV